jgi:deoxyadenosine/deoxycytidine kinase
MPEPETAASSLPSLKHLRYIAVDGPLCTGKTALVTKLAEILGGRTLFDPVEQNPFLERFYADPERFAFETQIHCLLSRYEQHRALLNEDFLGVTVVADYLLAKDRIYAYLNLDDDELELYERLYAYVGGDTLKPDFVVFLQASVSALADRVRRRGRPMERRMSATYLEHITNGYHTYFFRHVETPVLIVHTDGVDFAKDTAAVVNVIHEIARTSSGKRYFIPASNPTAFIR